MARNTPVRLRSGIFDLAIAAFAAAAIGFAGFAMPEWRLNQLLQMTGLPDILLAAQPPLGLRARLGVAGLLAGVTFVAVFMLMRLLDRLPKRRSPLDADEDGPIDVPMRLRRADAHPDNPVRRPLVAGRELGEPFEELLLVDVQPSEILDQPRPLPAFLVPDDEPLIPVRRDERIEHVELPDVPPSPEPVSDPAAPPPPRFRPVQHAPATEAPAPSVSREPAEPAPAPEPIAVEAPVEPVVAAAPAEPVIVAPQPSEAVRGPKIPAIIAAEAETGGAAAEESITDLMARLETGLRRRERAHLAAPEAAPAPSTRSESIGGRLRSAMSDLQKLTARG
jgi:hypothetical protein